MTEPNETTKTPAGRDRWIKIGFVLVLIAAGVAVYLFQQRDLNINGWENDLNAALAKGKAENRMIVAFFVDTPPSDIARTIAKRRIPKPDNVQALKEGRFIPVVVSLKEGVNSDLAKTYNITRLPTLVVFNSTGTERNRHEGSIGETDFRQIFLPGKKLPE